MTTTMLGGVEDAFSADLTNLGIRKSRKQTKDTYRDDAVKEGEAIVGGVVHEVGSESPIINEIVPQGRTFFSSARDDQLENHFTIMLNGVTASTGNRYWVIIPYQSKNMVRSGKVKAPVTVQGKINHSSIHRNEIMWA